MISNIPGCSKLEIDSEVFFKLKSIPKRVAVLGTGYVAFKMAGIFHTLDAQELFIRHKKPLPWFDPIIQDTLASHMIHTWLNIY